MEVEKANLNFLDLINLEIDEIRDRLSFIDIAKIISIYVANEETPKEEILNNSMCFISKKVLLIFDVNEVEAKWLSEIFYELYRIFEIIIDSISRNRRTIESSNISSILSYWEAILKKVEVKYIFNLTNVRTFVINALKFLEKYFAIINDLQSCKVTNDNTKDLNSILQESLNLHSFIMKILENHEESTICNSNYSYLETITKLLKQLLSITKTLANLNLIACTKTLKFLLKIGVLNATYINDNTKKNFEWLTDTVKFSCQEIHSLLKQFYNKKFENESMQNIHKYLKISLFFTQCLNKITKYFIVEHINGFHCIIPVYLEIFRLKTLVNPEIFCLIQHYLAENVINVIENVYGNEDFIKEYLSNCEDSFNYSGFCMLGLEIMRMMVIKKDQYSFSVYFYQNFFETFFDKISECPDVFMVQENYEKLETLVISLFFLYNENGDVIKVLEIILVNGILQYDMVLSRICFDIWVFLARCNAEICYFYFKYWSSINNSFPINCNDPRNVQIEYLLRILYENLLEEYKQQTWKEELLIENSRLLHSLGIKNIFKEKERIIFTNCIAGKLMNNLKCIVENDVLNCQTYVNLVNIFKVLSSCKISFKSMPKLMINFLKIIAYEVETWKHKNLIIVVLKFILNNLQFFSKAEKDILCNEIKRMNENSNNSVKFYTQKLIFIMHVNNSNQIEVSFKNIIESQKIISKETESLLNQSKSFKNNFTYIWQCNIAKFHCVSYENKLIERSNLKKIKLDDENDFDLVQSALKDAKTIYFHFQHNSITPTDLDCIREIIKLYENIVTSK